jgi:bacterial/archaeal transporter family-2 protein
VDKAVLAALGTILVGGFIALQAPINSTLGRTVGTFAASSVSFAIGTALLVAITVLVGGGYGQLAGARDLALVYFTGGLLGAAYVTTVLVTVRELGAGGVTAATIAGQLTTSVIIDRLGVLGLAERALTVPRLLGVGLLAVGTFLVVRY